jgi:hypothetical protein
VVAVRDQVPDLFRDDGEAPSRFAARAASMAAFSASRFVCSATAVMACRTVVIPDARSARTSTACTRFPKVSRMLPICSTVSPTSPCAASARSLRRIAFSDIVAVTDATFCVPAEMAEAVSDVASISLLFVLESARTCPRE